MPIRFLPNHEYVVLTPKERQPYYQIASQRDHAKILLLTLSEMKALWDNEISAFMLSYLQNHNFSFIKAKLLLEAYASPFFEKQAKSSAVLSRYREDYLYGKKQGWIKKKGKDAAALFVGKEIIVSGYFTYGDIISAYLSSLRGDMRIGYELEPDEPCSLEGVEVYSTLRSESRAVSAKVLTLETLFPKEPPVVCFGVHPISYLDEHVIYRKVPLLMPGEKGIWAHAVEPKRLAPSHLFSESVWKSLGVLTPARKRQEQQARFARLIHSGQLVSVSIAQGERPNAILAQEGLVLLQNQK